MKSTRILSQSIGILLILMISTATFAQKTISEGTFVYNISTQTNKASDVDPLSGATSTLYLKGALSRIDMASPLGKETTIYDAKVGAGIILKEYSGQKLMITLTKDNWVSQNVKFEGINFVNTAETKNIAGYNCTKATGKLKDGSSITVYYATDVTISNKDYNQIFKNLAGLPVEYQFENGNLKFQYLLSFFNPAAVPLSKFDFPKSGYRVMSYDESRQGKKEGN